MTLTSFKISIFNSLCYTIGWFICLFGGIYDYSLIAFVLSLVLIFIQLKIAKKTSTLFFIQDSLLVMFSIPIGIVTEMILIAIGTYEYTHDFGSAFPPLWVLMLYPLLALVLNHSLKFTLKNMPLAFATGFVFAPLSYIAGEKLGAVYFSYGLVMTYLMIGIVWGGVFLLFSFLLKSIEKASLETIKEADSEKTIELLYDGDCPLCNGEICYLKTRDTKETVKFVNIASSAYAGSNHQNISYDTAMKAMHAIDDQGKVSTGVEAFLGVYARCNFVVVSTLLRLPYVRVFLDPLYHLFAKYRLKITGR